MDTCPKTFQNTHRSLNLFSLSLLGYGSRNIIARQNSPTCGAALDGAALDPCQQNSNVWLWSSTLCCDVRWDGLTPNLSQPTGAHPFADSSTLTQAGSLAGGNSTPVKEGYGRGHHAVPLPLPHCSSYAVPCAKSVTLTR